MAPKCLECPLPVCVEDMEPEQRKQVYRSLNGLSSPTPTPAKPKTPVKLKRSRSLTAVHTLPIVTKLVASPLTARVEQWHTAGGAEVVSVTEHVVPRGRVGGINIELAGAGCPRILIETDSGGDVTVLVFAGADRVGREVFSTVR